MVRELLQYRQLLFTLTWRDIKVRYKQSVMGFLWALFMPLFIVASGILVKKAFSIVAGKPLVLQDLSSVSLKALPWAFFVGSIRLATNSLLSNRNLVTKIYFPREVLPISAVASHLFDVALASLPLSVVLAVFGVRASVQLLWLPVLIVILILFTLGLGMVLSCANLFFRDVKYIVDVVITFAIFFTPVFYEASLFGKWRNVLLLNPVGAILENLNDVVINHTPPDIGWVLYAGAWGVGGLALAWSLFHRLEPCFAENI